LLKVQVGKGDRRALAKMSPKSSCTAWQSSARCAVCGDFVREVHEAPPRQPIPLTPLSSGTVHQKRVRKMHDASATESVRRVVSQAFARLGHVEPAEIRETILIRDGYYCGRRFETDSAAAVWFVEENQVKVYRADGTIAQVLEPQPVSTSGRAAA